MAMKATNEPPSDLMHFRLIYQNDSNDYHELMSYLSRISK
jgi:hypothetical protein